MKRFILPAGGILFFVISVAASPGFTADKKFTGNRWQQVRNASGVVTADTGEPLANLTVGVKGTAKTTLTGSDGRFSVELPSGGKTLVFSLLFVQSEFNHDPALGQPPGY